MTPRQLAKRWAKTKRYQRMRAKQLKDHPWCQCPHCAEGRGAWTKATEVDHDTPHKGNARLYFDPRNLRSYGKLCHDKFKQSQERGGAGFLAGCDERGWPLSREHEWYGANI